MTAAEKKILKTLSKDLDELGFDFKEAIDEAIKFDDKPSKFMPRLDKDVDYGWEQIGEPGDEPIYKAAHILIGHAWDELTALRKARR